MELLRTQYLNTHQYQHGVDSDLPVIADIPNQGNSIFHMASSKMGLNPHDFKFNFGNCGNDLSTSYTTTVDVSYTTSGMSDTSAGSQSNPDDQVRAELSLHGLSFGSSNNDPDPSMVAPNDFDQVFWDTGNFSFVSDPDDDSNNDAPMALRKNDTDNSNLETNSLFDDEASLAPPTNGTDTTTSMDIRKKDSDELVDHFNNSLTHPKLSLSSVADNTDTGAGVNGHGNGSDNDSFPNASDSTNAYNHGRASGGPESNEGNTISPPGTNRHDSYSTRNQYPTPDTQPSRKNSTALGTSTPQDHQLDQLFQTNDGASSNKDPEDEYKPEDDEPEGTTYPPWYNRDQPPSYKSEAEAMAAVYYGSAIDGKPDRSIPGTEKEKSYYVEHLKRSFYANTTGNLIQITTKTTEILLGKLQKSHEMTEVRDEVEQACYAIVKHAILCQTRKILNPKGFANFDTFESRINAIKAVLRIKKIICNSAIRFGDSTYIRELVANPAKVVKSTKSNFEGNKVKGKKLKTANEAEKKQVATERPAEVETDESTAPPETPIGSVNRQKNDRTLLPTPPAQADLSAPDIGNVRIAPGAYDTSYHDESLEKATGNATQFTKPDMPVFDFRWPDDALNFEPTGINSTPQLMDAWTEPINSETNQQPQEQAQKIWAPEQQSPMPYNGFLSGAHGGPVPQSSPPLPLSCHNNPGIQPPQISSSQFSQMNDSGLPTNGNPSPFHPNHQPQTPQPQYGMEQMPGYFQGAMSMGYSGAYGSPQQALLEHSGFGNLKCHNQQSYQTMQTGNPPFNRQAMNQPQPPHILQQAGNLGVQAPRQTMPGYPLSGSRALDQPQQLPGSPQVGKYGFQGLQQLPMSRNFGIANNAIGATKQSTPQTPNKRRRTEDSGSDPQKRHRPEWYEKHQFPPQ